MKNLALLFNSHLFNTPSQLSGKALQNFLRSTGSLLNTGLSLRDTLTIQIRSKKTTIQKTVAHALLESTLCGKNIETSLQQYLLLPISLHMLLIAGSRTGELGKAMLDTVKILEAQEIYRKNIATTLQKPLFTLATCLVIFLQQPYLLRHHLQVYSKRS